MLKLFDEFSILYLYSEFKFGLKFSILNVEYEKMCLFITEIRASIATLNWAQSKAEKKRIDYPVVV